MEEVMSEQSSHDDLYKRMERMEVRLDHMSEQLANIDKLHVILSVEFKGLSESVTRNWAELSKKLYVYNETLYGNGKPGIKQQMNDVSRALNFLVAIIAAISIKLGYDFCVLFISIMRGGS